MLRKRSGKMCQNVLDVLVRAEKSCGKMRSDMKEEANDCCSNCRLMRENCHPQVVNLYLPPPPPQ